jgi:hypothetical protein
MATVLGGVALGLLIVTLAAIWYVKLKLHRYIQECPQATFTVADTRGFIEGIKVKLHTGDGDEWVYIERIMGRHLLVVRMLGQHPRNRAAV